MSEAVQVVTDADRAQALLDPTRQRILQHLEAPASAAGLAERLALPRQRLNYHLRELERRGFVELHHEKVRGSVQERVYRRTSDSYAISVAALGVLGARPQRVQDRFSSAYQVALASHAIAELGALREAAAAANKVLPTLTLEAEVRLANGAARSEFLRELAEAIAGVVGKHHDAAAPKGRTFRLYLGAYPKPARPVG